MGSVPVPTSAPGSASRDLVDGVSGQKHFNEADDTKPII